MTGRPWIRAAASRVTSQELVCRATVTRETGQSTDSDGVVTPTVQVVAAGVRCWVGAANPRRVESMGDRFAQADHRLRFETLPGAVQAGDQITVIDAPEIDLLQTVFDVVGVVESSETVTRQVWARRRQNDPRR